MKLLLAEDDPMIGEGLKRALGKTGYGVDWVQDGADIEPCLRDTQYSLLILDLGLPGKCGFAVLENLRKKKNNIPVLILTARDSVLDRVKGLDSGADDYMLKPFALEELEARIRLLLRRNQGQRAPVITANGMSLNPATHECVCKGKTHVLSAKEFALLRALMENPGALLSRAQLEEKLYGWNEEVASNTIEVHIHQLRRKLGRRAIVNTRGVGYSVRACA